MSLPQIPLQVQQPTSGNAAWNAVAGRPPAAISLISADETPGVNVNTTASETTSKSYALAANTFLLIIIESDVATYNADYGTPETVTVNLYIGAAVQSFPIVPGAPFGPGLAYQSAVMKYSAALTGGGTVQVTITPGINSGAIGGQALSLRVYGVMPN